MTNINCSSDCIHQNDGKCKFESVNEMSMSQTRADTDCVYYEKKHIRD